MKWRALPSLDVDMLSGIRAAVLGAGTLGCAVARTLLGWGVRKMTFVDSGRVSYSNPVRQSLFVAEDCENGGRRKALAAAESLATILGGGDDVESQGAVLSIPMPGHPFASSEADAVREDFDKLRAVIEGSDVVFLLTETRESRWLPTVMALASDTPLVNAALGLETWLVMRHGPPAAARSDGGQDNDDDDNDYNDDDSRLGCYFCVDVVAPEDSTRDRTLDQQCTN
jgi:ubiquitin-like modifier-activating enzyme ATG7